MSEEMKIKVTGVQLNDPEILQVLQKLRSEVSWKSMIYNIDVINCLKEVDKVLGTLRDAYSDLTKKHPMYVLDEKGEKVIDENGQPKINEEYDRGFMELIKNDYTLKCKKLSVANVHSSNLTTEEFMKIKFLFDDAQ